MNNQFSLISLFVGGDFAVVSSSIIMVIMSVMSWGVIIGKTRTWARARRAKINRALPVEEIMKPFDKNLWFLSMCSTTAPFIGLFGTVWGVMNAFASIGAAKSVSIAVIAPGLAAALGTTVIGLIVAIPATIAYQYFSKKSDDLYNELTDGKTK
ncbi:MAG: MotA/TolQ/ExbB proton channel family protein [Rickettsiales bacterium]|jgi:biopolymer transport protein ExbB/TolQ|nr:MotA/TolQ/ExbB proton channel family protein [Rickettsiales bacterium]